MKQIFTLIFAFSFSLLSIGQITISPEVVMFETSGLDFEIKPEVINNTSESTEIFWMFEKGENFPPEWSIIVCDAVFCYAPNIFKSSAVFPNEMEANETFEFKFTVSANGVAGSSYGIIHLYDDADCNNEVATSEMPVTAVEDEFVARLKLYPNPTQDQFSILDDENVKSIEVYNNIGQSILNQPHQQNELHSISSFSNGVYAVVLRDSENKILKTLQLFKE